LMEQVGMNLAALFNQFSASKRSENPMPRTV